MSYETFARRLSTLLTSSLRAVCQVNLLNIEQQTYDEYIAGLSTPTVLAPISTKPLTGLGVLEFSVTTALACVDHLLGGPGGSQPQRTLTDIETALIRDLMEKVLAVLKYALEPIAAVDPAQGPLEFNPPFLQAAGSTDMMIVGSFELRVGAEVSVATLCLPFAPLLPRLQTHRPQRAVTAAERDSATNNARALRTGLGDVPLDVSVRFDPIQLSPQRILSLQVGDVVALTHRVDAPLAVRCGDVTYAQAIAGRDGARLAAQIVDEAPVRRRHSRP
jgi:flagellar motor switch protein FliM